MLAVPQACAAKARQLRPNGDYAAEIEQDFAQIEPFLPASVDTIIDIGCGLAGIDVFLRRRYPAARLTLVDGDGDAPVYGWGERNNPYGSLELAAKLLEANGVQADEWITPEEVREVLKADLIVSLLAWGFHFPLSVYKVSGYCIADLRQPFEPVRGRVIAKNDKVARCAFTC